MIKLADGWVSYWLWMGRCLRSQVSGVSSQVLGLGTRRPDL